MSVTLHPDGFYYGNDYMTQEQMEVNATWVYNYFHERGWTDNAIAGILGNLQAESNINPGLWEGRTYWPDTTTKRKGYGLTQWTPWTNITNWLDEKGYSWTHISHQCERIAGEMETPGNYDQYYSTNEWPISGPEFTKSTDTPYNLACVFARNYERSAAVLEGGEAKEKVYKARGANADKWYEYITGITPTPPPSTKKEKSIIDLLLMTRRRYVVR